MSTSSSDAQKDLNVLEQVAVLESNHDYKAFDELLQRYIKYQIFLGVKRDLVGRSAAHLHTVYRDHHTTSGRNRFMNWNALAGLLGLDGFFVPQIVEFANGRVLPDVSAQITAIQNALSSKDPEAALAKLNEETMADQDIRLNEDVIFNFMRRLMHISLLIIAWNPDILALQECDFAPELMKILEPFGYTCGDISTTIRNAGITSRNELNETMAYYNQTRTTWLQKPGSTGPKLEDRARMKGEEVRTAPECSGRDDGIFVTWKKDTMVFHPELTKYVPVTDGISLCTSVTAELYFTDIWGTKITIIPGHLPSGNTEKDCRKRWESLLVVKALIKRLRDEGKNVVTMFDTNSDINEPTVHDDHGNVISGSAIRAFREAGLTSIWDTINPDVLECMASSLKGRSAASKQRKKIKGEMDEKIIDDISAYMGGYIMKLVNGTALMDKMSMPNIFNPSDHLYLIVDMIRTLPEAVAAAEEE